MALINKDAARATSATGTSRLTAADLAEITELYSVSYPGNWFDPGKLDTELYFGVREAKKLVAVAGVHVYSAQQRVAALGNIATHPEYRG